MTGSKKSALTRFGEIAYTETGSGPAALFVHGIFHNGHLWRHVTAGLADVRRCIAVDLMAHGDTKIAADQDVSFTAQAEMLDAFCAALQLDQVDVVANDSATGIVSIFAALHPQRIRSLVLTNGDVHDNWPPPSFERTRSAAVNGLLAGAIAQMIKDPDFARASFAPGYQYPERVSHDDLRLSLEPLVASEQRTADFIRFITEFNCRHTVAVEPQLKKVEAPTLVVWGTNDEFFDVKWAYWLKETIPGCRSVIELEGAKLFFPEERPDELIGPIRNHWHSVTPSS